MDEAPELNSPRDRGEEGDHQQSEGKAEQKAGPRMEVFCGRIPWEMTKDELWDLFGFFGPITDLKMEISASTYLNEGSALISFENEEDGIEAIANLNGMRARRGQFLKVTRRVPNTRLYIGSIPKAASKESLHTEISSTTDGLKEVIIYKPPGDELQNRGFCFLEYESHEAAAEAKRKLSATGTQILRCDVSVDWADPQQEVDSETMSRVRILYARNISRMVSEDDLWHLFAPFGRLERVKKVKDYAFIHFARRVDANRAKEDLHGFNLKGDAIEVFWSKPRIDKETLTETLRARESRVLADQTIGPVRCAVDRFLDPMSWNDGDEYQYQPGAYGDEQHGRGLTPEVEEPEAYFGPGYSGDPGWPEEFFVDQFPVYGYDSLPPISPSASRLERFPGQTPNWNTFPPGAIATGNNKTLAHRERPNQNFGPIRSVKIRESDQENWRLRP